MLLIAPILAIMLSFAIRLVFGQPRFLTSPTVAPSPQKISVIIPARNEETNLPKLLTSFHHGSNQPHEIIVVDDDSTDHTARIALENGARVITPPSLPDDWKGKPWACQQGANQATGEWLLFLDADVWLEPDAFVKILALTGDPTQVSSLCPYHRIASWTEELSAFFNLIMAAGSSSFGYPTRSRQSSALFGQSLLIAKKTYEQVEGHNKVRNQILENFHLAAFLREEGFSRNCFLGKGTLSMRMFSGGFLELWRSWKKGFTSGAKQAAPRALILISLWLTAGMMTVVSLFFLPSAEPSFTLVVSLAYLLFASQCAWAFRQVGSFSLLNAFLFPLGLIFYQILFFTSLLEKKLGIQTNWKGRDVY